MITIYGSPNCRFCTLAKDLADRLDISYSYIDVTQHEPSQEMFKVRGFKTVPQIFDNEVHVGGYQEFVKVAAKECTIT